MNLSSKIFCFALASAALVFSGCTKKPTRPDPSMTAMGPTPSQGFDTNPTAANPFGADTQLEPRSGFVGQENRDLLAAQTVYFDYDKSDIKPAERAKLKEAKDYLDKNPTHKLRLEGHCDWRGTAEYNLGLGDRRANAVKRYLQTIGVAPDKLETLSKGSLEAAKNADEATMAKDRRVNLIVVDPSRGAPPAI